MLVVLPVPVRRNKTFKRFSVTLTIEEHGAFRAAARREFPLLRRQGGDGSASEAFKRFMREYIERWGPPQP